MRKHIVAAGLVAIFGAAALASAVQAQPSQAANEGPALYAAKCAGCHGADGAKGLKGKSADFLVDALTGYRAKTFGGAKKEIMEARAAQLSDAEIQLLAQTIIAF